MEMAPQKWGVKALIVCLLSYAPLAANATNQFSSVSTAEEPVDLDTDYEDDMTHAELGDVLRGA